MFELFYFKEISQMSVYSSTFCVAEYLDGLKHKEEIYNQVYEDIQNNMLNRL